jgi:hypothetical protein
MRPQGRNSVVLSDGLRKWLAGRLGQLPLSGTGEPDLQVSTNRLQSTKLYREVK